MNSSRPNILLITIDTLRADMLGCYGHNTLISPNIDRLAASGIRFDQAITGGSWTQAAFPVLLTSSYASMYGGCLGPLAPERPSPIETLAAHGYTTGGFSTSPLLSRTYGYQRGFQHYFDLVPEETDPFLRRIKGGERLLRNPLTHYLSGLVGLRTRPARLYVSGGELTEQAKGWMETVQAPFFAWVHYMDIHWPYHLEEALTHPRDIAQAWRDLDHLYRVNWNGGTLTPAQRVHYMRLYEKSVQHTDAQVGRLLHALDKMGQLHNTVIILVSDHGEEFFERGRWGHLEVNLYDEIIKIPLIIHLPDVPGGRVIDRQVSTLDIMPTILDLCGCPSPEDMLGASLVPLWSQKGDEYDVEMVISEMQRGDRHMIAVRTESYKYVWDSRHPGQPQLFDLKTDPGEQNNVCDKIPNLARHFQSYVDSHRLFVSKSSQGSSLDEPSLNDAVIQRLRDLGYVE